MEVHPAPAAVGTAEQCSDWIGAHGATVFVAACSATRGDRALAEAVAVEVVVALWPDRLAAAQPAESVLAAHCQRALRRLSPAPVQANEQEPPPGGIGGWLDDPTRRRIENAVIARVTAPPRRVHSPGGRRRRLGSRRQRLVAGIGLTVVASTVFAVSDGSSSSRTTSSSPARPAPSDGGVTEPEVGVNATSAPAVPESWRLSANDEDAPGALLSRPPNGYTLLATVEVEATTVGRMRIWSEPGATRTDGRWLAVSSAPVTTDRNTVLPGAQRDVIAGFPALIESTPDGTISLAVGSEVGTGYALSGGGFTRDEMRLIAAGVTVGDERGVPTVTVSSALAPLLDGMDVIADVPSQVGPIDSQIIAGQRFVAVYTNGDGERIELATQARNPTSDALAPLLLGPSVDPTTNEVLGRSFELAGLQLLVGGPSAMVSAVAARSTVHWSTPDRTYTLVGTGDVYVLLGAATAVGSGAATEWADHLVPDASFLPAAPPSASEIGTTTTTNGDRWTVGYARSTDEIVLTARDHADVETTSVVRLDGPWIAEVTQFSSLSATTVLVAVVDATSASARFSFVDGSVWAVPLVAMRFDDRAGISLAAFSFNERLPFSVDLIDTSGRVTRRLG